MVHISISGIYKQFLNFNNKKTYFLMDKRFKQIFYQKRYIMANKHIKFSISSLKKCKVKSQYDITTYLLETKKTNYMKYSWQGYEATRILIHS